MDRNQEMENILKDLYVSAQNNKCFLNSKIVYSYLIRRNVNRKDLDKNVNGVIFDELGNYQNKDIKEEDFFSRWIERFSKRENIKVFCDPSWKYFCQFVNGDFSSRNREEKFNCIKMYIPLEYDFLYEGANRIFDFLERENILHLSRISSRIGFDNIVVRLTNVDDAKKLQIMLRW